jgi:hypothetical protein
MMGFASRYRAGYTAMSYGMFAAKDMATPGRAGRVLDGAASYADAELLVDGASYGYVRELSRHTESGGPP